jgi:SAM-dependent methyltransferase
MNERPIGFARVARRKLASGVTRLRGLLHSQRLGASPSSIYDARFYEESVDAHQVASANAVVDALIALLKPRSVFDVGCGNGLYLGKFADRGIEAFGCDGSVHAIARVPARIFAFQHDLKEPLVLNRRLDLCTCFEVAEHIPRRFSENLVRSCVAASQTVVFSSAPPGQGGTDHINEQPEGFWNELFAREGFARDDAATRELRERYAAANVVSWLSDNSRVYRAGRA